MSSADNSEYSDELLTRYLLGAVKANESERLDERSIADNELAWRLDALEHDLVDAFVRNELSGETLEQFKTFYLSSPARKAKVELARTLLNWSEERASTREMAGDKQVEHAPAASANHATGVRFGWLQWGLAAAAIVLCAFAFYLFEENNRLRKLQNEVQEQQTHLDQRLQQLEKQLAVERTMREKTTEENASAAGSGERVARMVAVLLIPPTRGLGHMATVRIAPGTETVVVRMQLESDDFPVYAATLKDPASGTAVWNDANLRARSDGQKRLVVANVPASVLKPQNYVLELSGEPAQGSPEIVSSYGLKVVLR
jgi:hypothetical protein